MNDYDYGILLASYKQVVAERDELKAQLKAMEVERNEWQATAGMWMDKAFEAGVERL